MKHSRTVSPLPYSIKLIGAGLILIPVILALSWGSHFADDVYAVLQLTRNLAGGLSAILAPLETVSSPSLAAYSFAITMSLPARFGIDLSLSALILSALGWSVTAFIFLILGKSLNRPYGALIAALLLSFNPGIINTLGSPVSWLVALFWLIVLFLIRRRLIMSLLLAIFLIVLLLQWPPVINPSQANIYGRAVAWTLLLFVSGMGADWLADRLIERDLVRLAHSHTKTVLLAIILIGLGSLQGIIVWQRFQERPLAIWALQENVADWLSAATPPASSLLADERITFLAQRSPTTMPDLSQAGASAAIQDRLQEKPVDYLVMNNNLPFQLLSESIWFRLAYEPVQQFNAPELPSAPYTVWAYRKPVDELGERQAINARVPDRLSILGYQIGPQQVQPGDSLQMALYLQAPEATNVPQIPFQAIIRLISPIDGSTVSEWEVNLPQSISPADWHANEVIIEQFPLTIPNELEVGAYQFNLSLIGADSPEMWPFSLDKDINRLDRIPIGGLVVPWQGNLDNVQQLKSNFADQIELVGFEMTEAKPGESLEVSLYWEALHPIDEDYVVFVHVLNSNGELVANHDSRPENGRFPTPAWLPGIVIPDTHTLLLPVELPAGEYQLKAGLYQPESGERLPAATAEGNMPADKAILLTKITIP